MWISSVEDFMEMKDVVAFLNCENLNKVIKVYWDIWIHTINDFPDLKRIICINGQTLESIFKFFSPVQKSDIKEYQNLFSSKWLMPNDITFNEEDNKWYLKYIDSIAGTWYHQDKKLKMIQKIVTLKFNEVKKYLEVFKTLDTSISMDVQRIKNELIDEILESDNPSEVAEQIKNIFEKNNLPLTWKIFKVFELLYPKEKFNLELRPASWEWTLWSPVLNNYKDEWKNVYRLIYKDLMNVAIKSWDRSLKGYLNTFIWSEKVLKKFENVVNDQWFNLDDEQCLKRISDDEKEQLRYLFKKIARLSNMFLWKELKEWIKEKVSDKELLNFYKEIKRWFNLRNWKSIYERLQTLLYVNWLKYHSAKEVLNQMYESKKQAHEHWLKLYYESNWWKIDFPKYAFLKWVTEDAFSKIINRWVTSREYLWWWDDWNAASSDCTPFDIDWWYGDSFGAWYGNVHLVIDTEKNNIVNTWEKWITWYDENKYELFRTWTLWFNHYWIRTWIPTTEVDFIIYTWNFKSKEFGTICYEIARNGYYIPIIDKNWNVKFTPEMYHKIRVWFNFMEYYDGYDVEFKDWKYLSCESDEKVNRFYDGENEEINNEELWKLIEENSPSNDKYKTFAKENKELAENTLERIKRILEEKCWIKFNSKYDSSIIWAEIHDSGSTGRWTDIPTKDVDLDFTLILDEKDYERVNEISKIIHEEIWTQKDDDHWVVEWWNQIKSKINNIWKSDRRPNWVPLDLLILKKSQVIDYSSSDAMKEKLKYIAKNPNNWVEDLDRVRTNVIIMKKLLKAKCCYKKPEWWISWIWVENRITQCHWSFIEALESFEQVAYGWIYEPSRQPLPLERFQECYPIYDAWENYKHWWNDNFVYKLKENGYIWILEIARVLRLKWTKWIRRLIKEYEKQKAEFIW